MSAPARIVFRAAIRRPLRSKRASTSPVKARSKASGLTRIRVRLTARAPFLSFRCFGRLVVDAAGGRALLRAHRRGRALGAARAVLDTGLPLDAGAAAFF